MKRNITALAIIFAVGIASAGWIPSPITIQIPTPAETLSLAATGTITVIAAPEAGTARLAMSWSAGAIKPASDTNTLTVTVITGTETNSYAFTNGAPSAAASGWITENSTLTATLSAGVTNLPAFTLSYISSPITVTRTIAQHERWKIYGLRRSGPLPSASATNAITVTAQPVYGDASVLGTFTNGAPAAALSSALSLWPGDILTVTATQLTNSPAVILQAEQYFLREPSEFPE